MTWILSLGGSIMAPKTKDADKLVDTTFIKKFYDLIVDRIAVGDRFIIIVGGGNPSRVYQNVYSNCVDEKTHSSEGYDDALDRIGIAATHLNAALLREIFSDYAEDFVVKNPNDKNIVFEKSVLIGAGWKPGFSTDLDAVLLAVRFNAKVIVNISNIDKIYTADPMYDETACALDAITWEELIAMVGSRWIPGMNAPFDPIACVQARDAELEVISVSGTNIENVRAVFAQQPYHGTRICSG